MYFYLLYLFIYLKLTLVCLKLKTINLPNCCNSLDSNWGKNEKADPKFVAEDWGNSGKLNMIRSCEGYYYFYFNP